MKRVAVLLFNLGGPKNPEDVQGFLYNLFADKNIINGLLSFAPYELERDILWQLPQRGSILFSQNAHTKPRCYPILIGHARLRCSASTCFSRGVYFRILCFVYRQIDCSQNVLIRQKYQAYLSRAC